MRPSTLPTAARTAAAALAFLCLVAGYNTALVIAGAARDGAGAGLIAACAVSVGVTVSLGYAATRLWRRGSAG